MRLRYAAVLMIGMAGCHARSSQFAVRSHTVDELGNIDKSQPYCQTDDEAFPATRMGNGSYMCIDPHVAKQHILKEQP